MKKLIVVLAIVASFLSWTQINGQGLLVAEQFPACSEDPDNVFCDMNLLNGYSPQDGMFTTDDTTVGPNPLCTGGGAPHNTSWFGFVAGVTDLSLTLDLFNCEEADCNGNPCWGVQIGVWDGCDQNDDDCLEGEVACPGVPVGGVYDAIQNTYNYQVNFDLTGLTVGEDYFVFLDGCAGSVCDYQVFINSAAPAVIPDFQTTDGIQCTSDCTVSGNQMTTCLGAELEFEAYQADGSLYDLDIEYTWIIDPPISSTFQFDIDDETTFEYLFDEEGTYELCLSTEIACDASNTTCIFIDVAPIDDENFGEFPVCEDILNDGIDPNDYIGTTDQSDIINNIDLNGDGESGITANLNLTSPGVETVQAMNSLGCEWEQMVEVVQIENEEDIEVVTYFCATEMVVLPGNPNVIINDFYDEDEIEYTAANGCTAIYVVTAWELEVIDYLIQQGPCTASGIQVFFDETSILLKDIELDDFTNADGTFTWIWTRNGIPITGTDNLPSYTAPFGDMGSFSVLITLNIIDPWGVANGGDGVVMCPQANIVLATGIMVDAALSSPVVSTLFSGLVCPEDSMAVNIGLDILGFDAAPGEFTINWSLPSDIAVISGGTTSDANVVLDYSGTIDNTISNEVCFEVVNTACPANPYTDCVQVSFAPDDSPVLDLVGLACPGGTFELLGNGVNSTFTNIDTIFWDLNGGNLISGDTTTVGPIEVMWPDTDVTQKVVTLTVSYVEACLEYSDDVEINFIIDPSAPTVTCFSNQNTITYEWGAVVDATEYQITLPDGTVETITDTSYFIDGLLENECRDIEVEAVTNAGTVIYCQDVIGLSPVGDCCTKECPAVTAALNNPYPGTICLDLNDTNEIFTVTFSPAGNPGAGIHNYSGPGIIDSQAGTFDPSSAGVGTHTIEYYYEYTDVAIAGCRTPLVSTMVTIEQLPTFMMSVDKTTVCVDEQVVISFDGTYDTALLTNLVTNGGTIIDDTDPQNIRVSWGSDGVKTITSEIAPAGCGTISPQPLMVTVDDLPQINIQCMPTSSSITFTWNTDPRFDDYTVTLSPGTTTTIAMGMIEVPGLNPGDGVEITVVGNSGNSCPNVTAFEDSCVAENCPEVTLISNPNTTQNICIDGTETPLIITGVISDPSLLSDPLLPVMITANNVPLVGGEFDPTAFGAGTYNIDLTLQDGNCPYFTSFVIEVEDVPTLDVNAAEKICITDTWDLDYVGEVNGDFTYDWAIDDVSTTTFSGAGDQSVDFDVPGIYTLTVNAETANCGSTEFITMVEVVDSLATPLLSCTESVGEILVEWIDGNDECDNTYSIFINGAMAQNTTDISYLVDNLMPGTPVTITVVNESTDCVCVNKETTIVCETLACPPLAIEIDDPTRVICRTSTETLGMEVFDVTASMGDLTDYTISYGGDATLTGNSLDPNALADGLYTVTAMAVNGFCDASASATLELITIPNVAFDYVQEICIEDDLTVTYVGDDLGAFDFEWTSASQIGFVGQLSPVITYDMAGDYSYTFTTMSAECGDASTAIVSVTVLDSLRTPMVTCSASLDAIELIIEVEDVLDCPGELMVLINGQPYTGDLTMGPIITIAIDNLDAGTDFDIDVINTSLCGCSDKSEQVMCSTLPCPELVFNPTCVAELDQVIFTWDPIEVDCGGVTTVLVDGELYTDDISNNSITIDGLDAGTDVEFEVIYTSNCGCDIGVDPEDEQFEFTCSTLPCPAFDYSYDCMESIDAVTVNFGLWADPMDEPDCGGVTTVFVNGELYTGDITGDTFTIDDLDAGDEVEFEVVYTSNCGCNAGVDDTDPIFDGMCTTLPCPPIDLQIINLTEQICLTGTDIATSLEVNADGTSLLPTDVVWSGLGINTMGDINLATADITAGIETYTATYTLAGCPYAAETTIQYIAQPTFETEVILPCPGETTATLNIINAQEPGDIVYTLDGSSLSTLFNIPLPEGTYLVESSAFGLCGEDDSVSFTAQPDVELEIVGDTMSFAGVENPYDIISNYSFDEVIWEINGNFLDNGAPIPLAYFEPGQLCVTGIIDDCPTTTCVTVEVNTEKVFISNIFNPGAPEPDNSIKVFANVPIKEIANLSVYDRWGNRVFHVENIDPTDPDGHWNGTSAAGEPLEQGVYIYAGEIEFLSGEIRPFVGDVTLVR